jgi:Rieske Fe-S protein
MAAIRLDDQGQFHPRRYCLGLASALRRLGGRIFEDARASDVHDGSPCRVRTGAVTMTADSVVLATQIPMLNRGLFFARTHPSRSYAMALRIRATPPRGMYLSADLPTRSVRSAERDALLIVGGEGHKVGQDPDTSRRYVAVESWAREHWEVEDVSARWSAQDYVPVDGTPYVGHQWPGSHVFVATGFAKWGMTNGTASGRIIADLISGRSNAPPAAFATTRVRPPLTSRATYAENVNAVVGHLIRDRLTSAPDADTLKPGEGGIVSLNGRRVAAYRHEDGELTARSPVCRHLGCLVSLNKAERTWDCPCHGSRYTADGTAIQGPTNQDLAEP